MSIYVVTSCSNMALVLGAYSRNKNKLIEIKSEVLGHFKDLGRKLFFKDLLFQNFLKLEQTQHSEL